MQYSCSVCRAAECLKTKSKNFAVRNEENIKVEQKKRIKPFWTYSICENSI